MRVGEDASSLPQRPALGVLFIAAASAWLTAVLVEHVMWLEFVGDELPDWRVPTACIAAIVLIAAGCVCFRRRFNPRRVLHALSSSGVAVVVLACLASGICSHLFWQCWVDDVECAKAVFAQGQPIALELTGDPAQRDYGIVSNARFAANGHKVDVRLLWPDSNESDPLSAGHSVLVRGSISTPKADEGGRWNHQNGLVGMVSASNIEETEQGPSLRSLVSGFRDDSFARIERYGGDGAGLLAGVLLGNRTLYAGSELEQAFKTTGLAHLMAVSGAHLAVVTMLVSVLLGAFRVPRVPRAVLTLLLLVFYVALTCFAPSAIRACAMCAVALTLGSAQRRKHVLSGLSLCVFVFIGLFPPMAFSLGFALSALSVCGLVVFEPFFETWTSHVMPRRLGKGSTAIAATLAATLMTLPVTVPMFAQLPLISPFANILAAPLLSAILTIGLLGIVLSAFLPAIGAFLLQFAAMLARFCGMLVQTLAGIPLACIPLSAQSLPLGVAFALLLLALWVAWPLPQGMDTSATGFDYFRSRAGFLARALAVLVLPLVSVLALGFAVLAPFERGQAHVVMVDVGQGDCMLIESAGHHVLVDTGEFGDVLQRGLARQGVTHLDAVILTHKDADHCGALKSLAGVVGVDHVYIHGDLLDRDFERDVLESASWVTGGRGAEGLYPGARLSFGEFSITMLAPEKGGESENEDSLVNLLEYDAGCDGTVEARGLLTGDAESAAIAGVVEEIGKVDVLKVPHHGSKDAVTSGQLASLSPEIALIGVGVDNEYGHPKRETLDLLEAAGARVYRTDLQGDVRVRFAPGHLTVETQR